MRISLDRSSDTPLYKQIEKYFRDSIESGNLEPETKLPSIRQLSSSLGVNRITIENAYAALEADGLVIRRVGSGTFVLDVGQLEVVQPEKKEVDWPLWQYELDSQYNYLIDRNNDQLLSAQGDHIVEYGFSPGQLEMIDFRGGAGDPNLFPIHDLRRTIQTMMMKNGIDALKYGDSLGSISLRTSIVHLLASQGLQTRAQNIIITSGSQQALSLIFQLLLKPGDTILVEEPTYNMVLRFLNAMKYKIVGIPVDEGGMNVARLEKLLQIHHPKLIYTIPNFHNPTGACMSNQRRIMLLELAKQYNVPVLEDDFVGDLRYEGSTQPTLKSLDECGRVIYINTFSKMLMPGLRLGFIIADGPVFQLLAGWKRINDISTSNLIQYAMNEYVTVGRYQSHLRRTRLEYRKRRDVMLRAISQYLPEDCHTNRPSGGLFVWLSLSSDISSTELYPVAINEGVLFAPGSYYFLEPSDGEGFIRLNFAAQPPEKIKEGIKRLGSALMRIQEKN